MSASEHRDLVVMGADPAGEKAAIRAASHGKAAAWTDPGPHAQRAKDALLRLGAK